VEESATELCCQFGRCQFGRSGLDEGHLIEGLSEGPAKIGAEPIPGPEKRLMG
jgi:hypothetical protein